MISEQEYLKAKKIVSEYDIQLRIALVEHNKLLKEKQLKREIDCGDHYYRPNGKWQSGMTCQDCGKTID